jgi:hypothetical protein
VIVGAVVLAVAGAALVAVVLLVGKDAKAASPSYPKSWDPRIAPYVKIVEKERGLTFLHPVTVRFLSPAAFEKTVTGDEKDLGKKERAQIDQAAGLLRALGLVTGDVDLFAAFNDAHGSGTLAYYSFDDQRITIRGTTLTPAVRPTLVHELTHALQDQRFGIGARQRKLRKEAEKGAATTESDVLDAVVEGDAQRVATLYRASLNAGQRRALAADEAKQSAQADQGLAKVPKVVLTMIGAPYTLGEAMMQAVAANGGNAAVDAQFRDTPTHDAVLLDPFDALSGDTGAAKVAVPALAAGEKKFDHGEFGDLTWYFMLAERLPLKDALQAADGWGGDAYVAFQRGGTSCARAAYVGDTPDDTARMLGALQRWIAAAPGSPAHVQLENGLVRFESCDPGTDASSGKDASIAALRLVATRTYLGVNLMRAGAPLTLAHCLSGRLVQEYPVASLNDPSFGKGDPAVAARVRQLAASCR